MEDTAPHAGRGNSGSHTTGIKQALVVVTWAGNVEETFPSFAQSLGQYRKYPLVVVVNESRFLLPQIRHFLSANYILLENEDNLWECGAIEAVIRETDIDEFVFLQDTMVVKNPMIFDKMFNEFPNQSVAFGQHWWCYLGKFRRSVLEQIRMPKVLTKKQAMYQEVALIQSYLEVEKNVPFLFHDWGLDNPDNYTVEKFGRMNLVLENPYIVKYSGTVANNKEGAFKTTELTWKDLEEDWEATGLYYS